MGEDREKHKSKDKHRDRDRGVEKPRRDDKTLRDDKDRSRRDRDKVLTQNLPRGFPCSERWGSITIPQEYANPLLDCQLSLMHRAACVWPLRIDVVDMRPWKITRGWWLKRFPCFCCCSV